MSATYLVTGANRGIGLELARQLVARGDSVIGTARRPQDAGELAELGVRVESLSVDDPQSVSKLGQRLAGEPIDVLINNAGTYGERCSLEELDAETLLAQYRTNAVGPLRVVQALLPNLRSAQTRRIVNVTSKMGSIADNSSGGSYGYRASKAALNALTRSLALDLAGEGFTCVVVHPGWVQTAMGGAQAPLSVEGSAQGILSVVERMDAQANGRFYSFSGEELPW